MVSSKNFLTPRLPLAVSGELEFDHIGDYDDLIRQNFKNLLLTIPGERTMDTDFGIGLQRYLFENSRLGTYADIKSQIQVKTNKYMPFIKLDNVLVEPGEDEHSLMVRIFYSVPTLSIEEYINLSFTDDGTIIS